MLKKVFAEKRLFLLAFFTFCGKNRRQDTRYSIFVKLHLKITAWSHFRHKFILLAKILTFLAILDIM
jgi:hypothetical protein